MFGKKWRQIQDKFGLSEQMIEVYCKYTKLIVMLIKSFQLYILESGWCVLTVTDKIHYAIISQNTAIRLHG